MPPNASEWFSDALLGRWNTMMPAGAALRSAEEVFSTTSMTHSLHCLVSPKPFPQFNLPAPMHTQTERSPPLASS